MAPMNILEAYAKDSTALATRVHRGDPAFRRTHRRMLRAYLATYCSEVLRGPRADGGKFVLGQHHLRWSDVVARADRALFLAPRDHGKSFTFGFGYPLWQADVRRPGESGFIISATQGQAQKRLALIRQEIEGGGPHGGPNPKLAHLRIVSASLNHIQFTNGTRIDAFGFETSIRGGHYKWAVVDDILRDDAMYSARIRERGIDKYLSVVEPMVEPGGQIVVIGTPFHATDLYAHLASTGAYTCLTLPAEDEHGDPLWPARYSREELRKRRQTCGPIRYAREYLCRPMSDDASLFPSHLWEVPGVRQPYSLGLPARVWQERGFRTFMGVDLALSSSVGADYFVAFVVAQDPTTGDRWVVDILRRKGLDYQDQVDLVVRAARRYGCGLVLIEANQYQRVIPKMVARTSDVPVRAFYTTSRNVLKQITTQHRGMAAQYSAGRNNLDHGVPGLRILFENGKVRVPWAPDTRDVVTHWLDELSSFSWVEGKLRGVGAHDDTVMAFWIANKAIDVSTVDLGFADGTAHPGLPSVDLAEAMRDNDDDYDPDDDWRPVEGVGVGPGGFADMGAF